MKGHYARITEEKPGTCGGCAYFDRGWNGGFPATSGKCKKLSLIHIYPPYGIGHDGQRQRVHNNPKHNRKYHARKGWDKEPPPPEYFRELERVSVNQIIWGGNYFVPSLTKGTRGWIVWDKGQHGLSMSDCELAY